MTSGHNQIYEHSGKIGLGPVMFVVLGLPAIFAVAAIYGFATVYNPLAGAVTIALVAGYVLACGKLMIRILKVARCRSRFVHLAAGIATGLFALWAGWFWFLIALKSEFGHGFDLIRFANPIEFAESIIRLNESGWFSISGGTPSGLLLGICWVLEALAVFGGSAWLIGRGNRDEMYCESCGRWCRSQSIDRFKAPAAEIIRDARTLSNLQPADANQFPAITAEALRCPACNKGGIRYSLIKTAADRPVFLAPVIIDGFTSAAPSHHSP